MLTTTFDYAYEYDPEVAPRPKQGAPQYVWELATMFPAQGVWSEEEYLSLTDQTNRLIEFSEGKLEFLPIPTLSHQLLMAWLFEQLRSYCREHDRGLALPSGTRIRMPDGKHREPDVVFVAKGSTKIGERYFSGADWVAEIVSGTENDRRRDLVEKVNLYAAAGIAEYWIVDPQDSKVTVFTLPAGETVYTVHGVFHPGDTATSVLLEGFAVDVRAAFDAAKG